MEKQTILLISDMRQVYLAEILTKRGNHVRCLDIRNKSTIKEQLVKLKVFLNKQKRLLQNCSSRSLLFALIIFL